MNNRNNHLVLVLFVLLLMLPLGFGIILMYKDLTNKNDKLKEYWETKNFKTDTIYVDFDYSKLPKPEFKYSVPPAQVIIYQTQPTPHITTVLNDSLLLVIDSLKNQITEINTSYFKLYPSASKILYAEFTYDSINLDLLSIDGKVRRQKYHVNYDRFKYQYSTDGSFKADPVHKSVKLSSAGFAYTGYDAAFKAPVLGADYSVYKSNLRLKGNTFITIDKQPQLSAQITIGLKLK